MDTGFAMDGPLKGECLPLPAPDGYLLPRRCIFAPHPPDLIFC